MADITDEESLDATANIQSENFSDEIIPIKDTETITENQSTENMEIHKHPHHVMHKKKWDEYLLEFFMLFLAVFLGFVTENWRENLVENKKEAEYMHELVVDLKSDTAMINESINYNKNIYESDSVLLSLLNGANKDAQTLHRLYQLNREAQNFDIQINDSKTFDQLKSSGDYRLIKNKQVLDSIASYYQLISVSKNFTTEIQGNLQLTYNFSFKIFDQYNFESKPNTTVQLITDDASLIKEYSNHLYNLESSYKDYNNRFLRNLKIKANNLIILLDKEYPGE